ncbi:MAG: hypothetical protein A7316_03820 [Candidatus Altiarchaeales archaeon WOR_SM1_86-2]|nr:MAG: hypothetical protein A7316_03820 [Candidatus Altiarchaeales archaeon WOR_SM1_86-2]ODS37737.1 MAG: hypothetical protein A7315_03825 [Candidatus Altiarchaeales archaeon WOR_SM1_79]
MKKVNIKIPEGIADRMARHELIDWNETLCREITFITSEREVVESILEKSTLTEKDVEDIDRKVKKGLFERYYGKT